MPDADTTGGLEKTTVNVRLTGSLLDVDRNTSWHTSMSMSQLYCRTEHFAADIRSEAVPGRISRLSVSPEFTHFCPTV